MGSVQSGNVQHSSWLSVLNRCRLPHELLDGMTPFLAARPLLQVCQLPSTDSVALITFVAFLRARILAPDLIATLGHLATCFLTAGIGTAFGAGTDRFFAAHVSAWRPGRRVTEGDRFARG